MTWQILIWNVFVWTFTGIMIYATKSSLWWLLLPAFFTGMQSASDLVTAVNEAEKNKAEDATEIDDETQAKMRALLEQFKRGKV